MEVADSLSGLVISLIMYSFNTSVLFSHFHLQILLFFCINKIMIYLKFFDFQSREARQVKLF